MLEEEVYGNNSPIWDPDFCQSTTGMSLSPSRISGNAFIGKSFYNWFCVCVNQVYKMVMQKFVKCSLLTHILEKYCWCQVTSLTPNIFQSVSGFIRMEIFSRVFDFQWGYKNAGTETDGCELYSGNAVKNCFDSNYYRQKIEIQICLFV